jgi:phosphate transport system substrate-binding protein
MPADYRVSITDADGADAYPISSFTYILVHKDGTDAGKATALARFLWWAIHDGQQFTTSLEYAQLPAGLVTNVEATLRTLTAAGQPIALP